MIDKIKTLNKTVAKFIHRGIKYEVDMLLDTKYGDEGAATPGYKFHVFDITNNDLVGEFDGYDGADYIMLAKQAIKEGI